MNIFKRLILCLLAILLLPFSFLTVFAETAEPSAPTEETQEEEGPVIPDVKRYRVEDGFPAISAFTVNAGAAALYELNSDTLLYGQDLDKRIYPASLAKVLTCLVAIENGNLEDEVTVSETALQNLDPDGTSADLRVGEIIKLEDLLYCVMLASANEACNVVAEHIAGSTDAFVRMLNERAAELGCTDSHFANAHGLHHEDEYTTVRNLMYIAREALKNETFRTIAFSTTHELPATNFHPVRTLYTTNYMISTDQSFKYYYEKAAGVKTGYTSLAGRCLITTAADGELELLSIVTGCDTTEEGNGEVYMHNFPESKKLLEYGFENFDYITILSPIVPVSEVSVTGGERDSVVVAPLEEGAVSLPYGYDDKDIETVITVPEDGVKAPVAPGDIVGTVTIYYQGEEMGSSPITPITEVPAGSSSLPGAAETEPKERISVWKILFIVAITLVGAYLVLYIYVNIRRRQRTSQPAHRTQSAGRHKHAPTERRRR